MFHSFGNMIVQACQNALSMFTHSGFEFHYSQEFLAGLLRSMTLMANSRCINFFDLKEFALTTSAKTLMVGWAKKYLKFCFKVDTHNLSPLQVWILTTNFKSTKLIWVNNFVKAFAVRSINLSCAFWGEISPSGCIPQLSFSQLCRGMQTLFAGHWFYCFKEVNRITRAAFRKKNVQDQTQVFFFKVFLTILNTNFSLESKRPEFSYIFPAPSICWIIVFKNYPCSEETEKKLFCKRFRNLLHQKYRFPKKAKRTSKNLLLEKIFSLKKEWFFFCFTYLVSYAVCYPSSISPNCFAFFCWLLFFYVQHIEVLQKCALALQIRVFKSFCHLKIWFVHFRRYLKQHVFGRSHWNKHIPVLFHALDALQSGISKTHFVIDLNWHS